jgi:predicted phosphodiesterase
MRFLCLSDLHGNAEALHAVLATAERRGFHRLVVAGDLCYPGPAPLATWRLLVAANATMVRGMSDRALASLDLGTVRVTNEQQQNRVDLLRSTRTDLGDIIVARLGKLPDIQRIPLPNGDEMVVVHGSPADPTEPFTHDMSDEEISALLGDDPADVVICGGSHVPFERWVSGVHIINVGSVGEAPGGKHADATFVEITPTGLAVEQIVVPIGPDP